jgi:hypothetical protein
MNFKTSENSFKGFERDEFREGDVQRIENMVLRPHKNLQRERFYLFDDSEKFKRQQHKILRGVSTAIFRLVFFVFKAA